MNVFLFVTYGLSTIESILMMFIQNNRCTKTVNKG